MRPARRPRERPRAVRVCDVRWKVRVSSRSNDAFAREIAARGAAWGENSHAESDVSSVANGHPYEGIERGRGGASDDASVQGTRRGVEAMRIIVSRRSARALGAEGERRGRDAAHVTRAVGFRSVGWTTDLVYFSWVANRQMQKRGERSVVERVGLRATSGNGSDELACDVCQVNPVYVMCHEDRAFLCRTCDVSIHSANGSAAKHQRFLFTNTRVELQALGAGEEVGRRTSPTDSAADHMVPQFEQEEVGRKVRFFRHGRRNTPESANIQGTSKLTHNFHFKTQRKYNRQQKASVQSDDATVPSINDLAPGVFESFMTDLLGEEEGRQHAEKATDNETDFWGEIFSDNWAAMGGMEDDLTVPDYDQQVPNF